MKRLNQTGAVSLLSVSIFAVIITVVTTLYIRTAIVQQRDSITYDHANRALYASFVGYEDTKRAIESGVIIPGPQNKKDTCPVVGANGDFSSDLNLSYTCQLVDFNPTKLEAGPIKENASVSFPIQVDAPAGNYQLRLTWSPGENARNSSGKSLPTQGYWLTNGGGSSPPMIRSQIVTYPTAASPLTRDQIKSQSFYLNPSTGSGSNTIDSTPAQVDFTPSVLWGVPSEPIKNVLCSESGTEYSCEARINLENVNFQNNSILLVLKSIYTQTNAVSVELLTSSGAVVPFTSGQAVIDITGKSNNVFKRIQQTTPYGRYHVSSVDLPDFSIVSGEGLCKQMALSAVAGRSRFECSADSP